MKKILYSFLLASFVCVQADAQCTATITPANTVTVCAGTTTTFTANTAPNYTYQWKLNGTNIAGATNSTYTTAVAGSYSVTIYNGSCSATSNAVALVVNPLPTVTLGVTPSATICSGDTAHICLTSSLNGGTYTWLYNGAAFSYPSTCFPIPTAGSITMAVTSTQGCTNTSAPMVITVNPAPAAPTAGSNSPVSIGQTIMLTATSNALSGTYSWIGPNGFTSTTQNPQLANATAAMAGTYSVSVSQGGCPSPYANTTVVISDLVWPGDVNYDLMVDNNDVLALGVAYNQTGVTRAGASLNWVGQYCANWSATQMSLTTNMKHADCNGDGTVNSSDQAAITQNYSLTHPRGDEHHAAAKVTGLPDLYFDTQGITFTPGATVTIPIKLGSASTTFLQYYGLAAQIKMSGLTLTAPMQITYNNSWIGNASNTLRFTKDINFNRLDWAYVRTDHMNIDGNGTIAELTFTIPANAPTSQIQLHFDNVKIINTSAAVYTNYYNVIDNTSSVFATAVPQANSLVNTAAIVPNPSGSNASIQLDLAKDTDMQVNVTDASGRTVWTKEVAGKAGKQQIQLPNTNLATGIYQVVLKTKEGAMIQTLKWMRD